MKFATLIDPALQNDLYCEKPWVFSPMLCSMNLVDIKPCNKPLKGAAPADKSGGPDVAYKPPSSAFISSTYEKNKNDELGEWIWFDDTMLQENNTLLNPDPSKPNFDKDSVADRRKYYQKQKHRLNTKFLPDKIYNFEVLGIDVDFCSIYGFEYFWLGLGHQCQLDQVH